jgi:iron complex outermembrane receptor protein
MGTGSSMALSATPPVGSEVAQLEEVIVTAQRREENLQRAAVAVSVVQGSDLIAAGITDAGRLGNLVPALTIEPSSTGNLMFLRGVGNFTVVPVSDPAIAYNYDGVYVGRPTSTNGSFFDLQRIEVLKGPQGTLYGRNATGGAINVVPQRPRYDELSGYANVSYGNYSDLTAEGALNLPISGGAALRFSGIVKNRAGYYQDGGNDDKSTGLRAQWMAALTPALTVRIAGDFANQTGVGTSVSYVGRYQSLGPAGYRFVPSNVPLNEGVYSAASQAFRLTGSAAPAGRRPDLLAPFPGRDNQIYGVNAEVQYQTGAGTLTIIPAYRETKLNLVSDAAAFMFSQKEKDKQTSLEARFNSQRIGLFEYTVGGFYYDEKIDSNQVINTGALMALLHDKLTTKSFAPFARVTVHVSDTLRLVGGARYTQDKKTFGETGAAGTIVCLPPGTGLCPNAPLFPFVNDFAAIGFSFPPANPISPFISAIPLPGTGAIVQRTGRLQNNKLTFSRTTWRAAVEYDIAPRSLLYVSTETGFRSGGFSGAAGFETYNPEFLTAYTVGSKNRLLDNRLQLNLEGFYWKYKDQQVNFVGLDANNNTANQTRNIGKSKITGLEVESQFLVTPATLLGAIVQYLDAKAESYVYPTSATGARPLTGCALTPNANPTLINVDCSAFPNYNSPKWTVNLAAQQTISLSDYKVVLGLDTQYKSSRFMAFQYLPEQLVAATWSTNAQVSLSPTGDRWSVAVYLRNIEDKRTPTFLSASPSTNFLVQSITAPRSYGVRVAAKF